MSRKYISIVMVAALVLLVASPVWAWKDVRTGARNFEKAWQAYTSLMDDKARGHFVVAADAFAKGLNADPTSRSARQSSNLTMAGISFYMVGRYAESVDAMNMAYRVENKMWEANLFIGLSWLRQGDKTKGLEFLQKYLESMPSQRILSNMVAKQMGEMNDGVTDLDEAAANIDKAVQLQFIHNISLNYSPCSLSPSTEQCRGPYWWRRNSARCDLTSCP